jgi:hypothetical protein
MGDRVAMYATVASRFGAERADLLQTVSTTGNVGVHDDLAAECDVILAKLASSCQALTRLNQPPESAYPWFYCRVSPLSFT